MSDIDGSFHVDYFRLRFREQLERIRGAHPSSVRGQLILSAGLTLAEELAGRVTRALEDDNSRLRQELAALQLSHGALSSALASTSIALRDAQKSRKGGLARAAVRVLVAALAVGESVAGSAIYSHASADARDPSTVTIGELYRDCRSLDLVLDESGVYAFDANRMPHNEPSATDPADSPVAEGDADDDTELDDVDFDDDEWMNHQDNDGNFLLPGADPIEGAMWRNEGFTPTQAEDWRDAGFDPVTAALWHQTHLTHDDAASWHAKEFEPDAATEWLNSGFTADEASGWRDAGFDAELAEQWHSEDFSVQDADEWESRGIDPFSASDWKAVDFSPDDAAAWASEDFEPEEAQLWRGGGYVDPTTADNLRDQGVAPGEI